MLLVNLRVVKGTLRMIYVHVNKQDGRYLISSRRRKRERVKENESVSRSKTSLDCLDDVEVIKRHRLPRKFLVQLVELVKEDVERPTKRNHSLSALTQVC